MKEILWSIFMYPFVLADNIWSFFYRMIDNIKDCSHEHQFNYDDIVEIRFYDGDVLADALDSMIFYEKGNNKPDDDYFKIIPLEKKSLRN